MSISSKGRHHHHCCCCYDYHRERDAESRPSKLPFLLFFLLPISLSPLLPHSLSLSRMPEIPLIPLLVRLAEKTNHTLDLSGMLQRSGQDCGTVAYIWKRMKKLISRLLRRKGSELFIPNEADWRSLIPDRPFPCLGIGRRHR